MPTITKERLIECRDSLREALRIEMRGDLSPRQRTQAVLDGRPDFIQDASDDELIEWDIELYALAIDGFDARGAVDTRRVLTCVYCGHAYPQDAPTWGHEVLTAHIRACPAHPMRSVIEERDQLRAALVGLVGEDGRNSLVITRAALLALPIPDGDRAATVAAIDALLATIPEDGNG